jgi:hypothetical protein
MEWDKSSSFVNDRLPDLTSSTILVGIDIDGCNSFKVRSLSHFLFLYQNQSIAMPKKNESRMNRNQKQT